MRIAPVIYAMALIGISGGIAQAQNPDMDMLSLEATPAAPTPALPAEAIPVGQASAPADEMPAAKDSPPPDAVASDFPEEGTQAGEEEAFLPWEGSLMFPQARMDELTAIYNAYMARLQGQQPDAEGSSIAEETLRLLNSTDEEEKIDEELYALSLNSILYDTPTKWSIWINGKRYSREEAMGGFKVNTSDIRVVQASDKMLTYVWEPQRQSYPLVRQRWRVKQDMKEQGDNHQVASEDRVALDEASRQVTVTLRPNQTFYSQNMTVMEGKSSPPVAAPAATPADEDASSGEVPQTPSLSGEIPAALPDMLPQEMSEQIQGGQEGATAAPEISETLDLPLPSEAPRN